MNKFMQEFRASYGCYCAPNLKCERCTKLPARPVLDYSQIENVDVDGIDFSDANDFCDAYICSATYMGRDMTDAELDVLNEDGQFVYDAVINKIY